jgi:catechol 2,3-dioxygenase-like lactoylglutathione lyase family enzyme
MLSNATVVAFVPTTDLTRARNFYEKKLGLPVRKADQAGIELDVNGTILRVAAVPQMIPASYTVLGWQVADLRAEMPALQANGVQFERYQGLAQDDNGVWAAPSGSLVCWFKDPDGNVISLTQAR